MSKNQKGQQYKIRFISNTDHEKLKQIGKDESRSINYLINYAIKQFLKEKEE